MAREPHRARPTSGLPAVQPNVEPIRIGSTDEQTPEVTDSQTPEVTDSQATEVPRYQRMVRKEARIRPDQADALAALRRRIAAQRQRKEEPITDNTLLRIAVDLLLANADHLAGDTETQLTNSVTHRQTDSLNGRGSDA